MFSVMISRRAVVCYYFNDDADYDMMTNHEHSNVFVRMFI